MDDDRAERQRQNMAKLQELRMHKVAEEMDEKESSGDEQEPKQAKAKRSKEPVDPANVRKSERDRKGSVTYKEDDYFKDLNAELRGTGGGGGPRGPKRTVDEEEVEALRREHGIAANEEALAAAQDAAPVKKKKRGHQDSGKGVRIQGGRVYDSKFGVTCHWCRQKTLEEHVTCTNPNCGKGKRLPTSFCKMCLRNRHGEDCVAAAASDKWQCPQCRGSCGKGCITCCNCGPCRKKLELEPTHQVIKLAKTAGFSNVHDYLVHIVTGESVEQLEARKLKFPWGRWLAEPAPEGGVSHEDQELADAELMVEAALQLSQDLTTSPAAAAAGAGDAAADANEGAAAPAAKGKGAGSKGRKRAAAAAPAEGPAAAGDAACTILTVNAEEGKCKKSRKKKADAAGAAEQAADGGKGEARKPARKRKAAAEKLPSTEEDKASGGQEAVEKVADEQEGGEKPAEKPAPKRQRSTKAAATAAGAEAAAAGATPQADAPAAPVHGAKRFAHRRQLAAAALQAAAQEGLAAGDKLPLQASQQQQGEGAPSGGPAQQLQEPTAAAGGSGGSTSTLVGLVAAPAVDALAGLNLSRKQRKQLEMGLISVESLLKQLGQPQPTQQQVTAA